MLTEIRALKTFERPGQGNGYGAERHAENFSNFAVAKAFGAQRQNRTDPLGGARGRQPSNAPAVGYPAIVLRDLEMDPAGHNASSRKPILRARHFETSARAGGASMRGCGQTRKNPPAQISAGLAKADVPNQSEKYLLDNLLAFRRGYAE